MPGIIVVATLASSLVASQALSSPSCESGFACHQGFMPVQGSVGLRIGLAKDCCKVKDLVGSATLRLRTDPALAIGNLAAEGAISEALKGAARARLRGTGVQKVFTQITGSARAGLYCHIDFRIVAETAKASSDISEWVWTIESEDWTRMQDPDLQYQLSGTPIWTRMQNQLAAIGEGSYVDIVDLHDVALETPDYDKDRPLWGDPPELERSTQGVTACNGMACHFAFLHQEQWRSTCIRRTASEKPWCQTSNWDEGKVGQCGDCSHGSVDDDASTTTPHGDQGSDDSSRDSDYGPAHEDAARGRQGSNHTSLVIPFLALITMLPGVAAFLWLSRKEAAKERDRPLNSPRGLDGLELAIRPAEADKTVNDSRQPAPAAADSRELHHSDSAVERQMALRCSEVDPAMMFDFDDLCDEPVPVNGRVTVNASVTT